jgi:bifunctional non-homologous end joining protein LigD
MLAVNGELPPASDEGSWSYEMKWDGVRIVCYLDPAGVELYARSGRDVTANYPELAGLAAYLGRPAILDGEAVAFDSTGRVSFAALQPRIQARDPRHVRALLAKQSVVFLVFDVLHLDGESLLDHTYAERHEILRELEIAGPHWQTPPAFEGLAEPAMEVSTAQNLEGVVAKRLDSKYESGKRSHAWIKVKHVRTQEVVIGGWRPGEGGREGMLGSVLCGVYEGEGLRYVGRVGSGFDLRKLKEMESKLAPLARRTSPFDGPLPRLDARGAHWVEPELVGEAAFALWTPDGRLWHPTWRGLRMDKSPREVIRES